MEEVSVLGVIQAIISIAIIDLALSGDNAAVIGLAIKDLPPEQRKKASLIGAGGAIILRVIFTAIATVLLTINYLSAFGGLVLIYITWKLVAHNNVEEEDINHSEKFWGAVTTIIIADLSMAFDNVMGVAGAAHGEISLVIFGLGLSVPILVFGSNWLAKWMNKHPFIIYVGAAVLAHTAVAMIFHDKGLGLIYYVGNTAGKIIPWLCAIPILIWGWFEAEKIKQERLAKEPKIIETKLESVKAVPEIPEKGVYEEY